VQANYERGTYQLTYALWNPFVPVCAYEHPDLAVAFGWEGFVYVQLVRQKGQKGQVNSDAAA
jgi:hypothetical protein